MTQIELLITVFVVGVLGLAAVLSVNLARSRTRDAVRLSDIRQVQAALELHASDVNDYPISETFSALGLVNTACMNQQGFVSSCDPSVETVYLRQTPAPPEQGLKRESSCGGLRNAYCYLSSGDAYRLMFELELPNRVLGLDKGRNCATENGIGSGVCPDFSVN